MKPPRLETLKAGVVRHPILRWWIRRREDQALVRWVRNGQMALPPPAFKQHVVRDYARRFAARTLIESGTYLGEMVDSVSDQFERIYSIELDEGLHRRACTRLRHLQNVSLLLGDSGNLLGGVLAAAPRPCLLWLDGHYSGGVTARGSEDTPIRRELSHVFAAQPTKVVILIDDARCFDGTNGYPSLEELIDLIRQNLRRAFVSVAEDIVRVTPRAY